VKRATKIAVGGVGGVLAIGLIVSAANGGSDDSSSHKAPAAVTPKTPSAVPPKHTPPQKSERDDLTSFKLDDRSTAGITDVWVKWSITNHSSKKSDYTFDWEAVNSSGVRVANSTELVTDVQPGQVAKGSDFTTLNTAHVTLHITKFDRTESF